MRLIPSFNGRDIFKVQIDYAIDYEQNPVHYNSQPGTCADCGNLMKTILLMDLEVCPEPILPIRRMRKLRRAPETPGGPLALKDVLILVSFLSLASGYENMNDHFF